MARRREFVLSFAPETIDHMQVIERKYHSLVERTIHEQLTYAPADEARNRKPLEQPASFSRFMGVALWT